MSLRARHLVQAERSLAWRAISRCAVIQTGNAMTTKRGSPGFGPVEV
jgi:hypothetical protein